MAEVIAAFAFVLIGWFGTVWGFVAVMNLKRIMVRAKLSLFWRVNLFPLGVVALLGDVVFWNFVLGTIMYAELPREWTFSERVQRHYRTKGWRGKVSAFWAGRLNEIDAAIDDDDGEAHIHEPRT